MSDYQELPGGMVKRTVDGVAVPRSDPAFQQWWANNSPDPADLPSLPQVEVLKTALVTKGVLKDSDLPKPRS